jgi:hypothetical protein
MHHSGPPTADPAAADPQRSWNRRVLLGLPALLAVAGCSIVPNPYKQEDDAVADALSSEPMWVTYRPAWVTKESSHMGWRSAGDVEGLRDMQSFRLLFGAIPAAAVATARAAAVQAGWSTPDETDFLQLRRVQGKERSVTLRLSVTATDTALGITINGSFG